jgi:hypothetical protein
MELKFPLAAGRLLVEKVEISPFDDLAQSADWLTLMSRPNPLAALNRASAPLFASLELG